MIHIRKFCLLAAVFSLIILSFPVLSSAHAYIIKSSPAESQTLEKIPEKVSIEFDEAIQKKFYSIQVFNMKGTRVDKGDGVIDPNNPKILKANLKPELPNGIYSIKWRIVSSDGHPIDGVISFQVGKGSKSPLLTSKTSGYVPQFDFILIRWVQYIGGAAFVGLLFFYLFVIPKESFGNTRIGKHYRKIINISYVFWWIGILLSLPMQAKIESGVSWLKVFNWELLKGVMAETLFGKVWLVEVGLLLLLLLTIKRNKKLFFWWASFGLGVLLLFAKAITSHAVSTNDLLVAIEFDFLHLLTASIWVGSIFAMIILLPLYRHDESKTVYIQMIQRFFTWGKVCVFLLFLSGVYTSLKYVPTIHSLFNTNYGRVLVAKVILFAIMLLFAWLHSTKARKDGEHKWGKTLWGEMLTGAIVLILAVVLANLPTAYSSIGPFEQTKKFSNKDIVTLEIGPNVIGQNTFEIKLKDKNGKPLTGIDQVSLTFTTERMDMGENTVILPKDQDGQFKVKGMYLNMAGPWKIHVHVLKKSLESLDADFNCIVGSQ